MSPAQCRKARTLLDWTPADLARAAGVSVITVQQFEAGTLVGRRLATSVMRRAMEGAGISFPGKWEAVDGVRLDRRS